MPALPVVPDSALITIGEPASAMQKVDAGLAPGAEYSVFRRDHFSKVITMANDGYSPADITGKPRFALHAYRESWTEKNIYLNEEFPGIEYLFVHALLRRRKRVVMMVHNVASQRRYVPLVRLRLATMVDHFLCISERSREELQSRYNVPSSRITVIGSRVDTTFFTPDPTARTGVQICAAGAVNRDYTSLVEAVRPLGIPTKIAADTPWKHSTGEGQTLTLPDFVEMRSWGSYVNLRQLYAESAVTVVPLGKPMLSGITVALEAMAMGKPVILSYNPYLDDFLRDGDTGYFVRPNDPEALRQKIRHVLDHPQEAERIGARAREWVLERFTVAHYVKRILSVW